MTGVSLLLGHPEIPSCADCQAWLYDADWKRAKRGGTELPRPAGTPTPCWKCPKSDDKKTPNPAAELTGRNLRTLELYLEIKAGRPMPDDAIVWRNCGLIRWVEDCLGRQSQALPALFLGAMLGGGGAGGRGGGAGGAGGGAGSERRGR